MAIFIFIAFSDFKTPESIATPCSVKAKGKYFVCFPLPLSKDANCDLKDFNSF